MIDLNQIDDLARRLSDLVPPGLRESREELQATFKSALQAGLAKLDLVEVIRKGRVAVTSETSYSDGQPVLVRFIATGGEVAGQVRSTVDANDCAPMTRARFVGSGSAGIAVIELNLP